MKLLFLLPALLAQTPSIDGVWRSVGWGYIYEIRGSTLQAFEVTSSTCVTGFRAQRLTVDPTAGETKFQVRRDTPLRLLHPSDSAPQRIVQAGVMTSIVFERLDSLPAIGTGLVLGALIGGVVAFLQLASTSFTTTMLGYELIFAVLCFVVSKIVQKVKG